MDPKAQASKLIDKFAPRTKNDPVIALLVSEARSAFRRASYTSVIKKLSTESIARQRSLY